MMIITYDDNSRTQQLRHFEPTLLLLAITIDLMVVYNRNFMLQKKSFETV